METLTAEKKERKQRESIKSLNEGMNWQENKKRNKKIQEIPIEQKACSIRENLFFTGIPEKAEEDNLFRLTGGHSKSHLLPLCPPLGRKGCKPGPIMTKFEHFKQKELEMLSVELSGTDFRFNKKILERSKVLFLI